MKKKTHFLAKYGEFNLWEDQLKQSHQQSYERSKSIIKINHLNRDEKRDTISIKDMEEHG